MVEARHPPTTSPARYLRIRWTETPGSFPPSIVTCATQNSGKPAKASSLSAGVGWARIVHGVSGAAAGGVWAPASGTPVSPLIRMCSVMPSGYPSYPPMSRDPALE